MTEHGRKHFCGYAEYVSMEVLASSSSFDTSDYSLMSTFLLCLIHIGSSDPYFGATMTFMASRSNKMVPRLHRFYATYLCALAAVGPTSRFSAWAIQPSNSIATRSKFLSSSATAFLATTTTLTVMGSDPEECQAAPINNPRYIDKELEMKYGEDKGTIRLLRD